MHCVANIFYIKRAIKRNGANYIWCRELCDYLGVTCNWKYDCAEFYYKEELYRFSYGAYSVMTKYVGGISKKLSHKVIIINGHLYISIDDVNELFELNLICKR